MLDLTRFCALCGSDQGYSYYDEDDLDKEDCTCREGDVSYSRQLRRKAEGRSTCEWFEEVGDVLMDRCVSRGPICGKPATHISCVPYTGSHTCEEHKCRCSTPIKARDA